MPVIRNSDVKFEEVAPGWMRRQLVNQEMGGAGACTLGEVILEPGASLIMHNHKLEEVFFITDGTATLVVDGETTIVEPNSAILVPAGAKHLLVNKAQEPLRFVFFHPGINVGREVFES